MDKNYSHLKILVIGLGSMGKRRIRNLKALGVMEISGFDLREDRRQAVSQLYGIEVFESFETALQHKVYNAWVISVPPHIHHVYIKESLQKNVPAFIEASVVDTCMDEIIKEAEKKNILLAPSCTLFFHPAIKKISRLLQDSFLGKLSNMLYHSGQYLPDWHVYEKVSDYYVSNKETGGAREIVPFELTWVTMLLGFPYRVAGINKKTIEIEGASTIDDTYNILLDYKDFIFNLSVDVVSRSATRRLVINGDRRQLSWDWNENLIKIYDPEKKEWENIFYETSDAYGGYNKNITETMYNEEVNSFLQALLYNGSFPNTLKMDHKVLRLLYAVEKSSATGSMQTII